MATVQRCRRCGQDLPLEAFSPSKRGRNGVWCRSCHSAYNRDRNYERRPNGNGITCAACGNAMRYSTLPQGKATCLPCRQAQAAQCKLIARPPKKRICPMCRRTFEHHRRTYCGPFCRLMGSRVGGFRYLFHLEGEYRQALWWIRKGSDPRWIIGPPRMLLDVWQAPNGDILCPESGDVMTEATDAHGLECYWCGIRVIPL